MLSVYKAVFCCSPSRLNTGQLLSTTSFVEKPQTYFFLIYKVIRKCVIVWYIQHIIKSEVSSFLILRGSDKFVFIACYDDALSNLSCILFGLGNFFNFWLKISSNLDCLWYLSTLWNIVFPLVFKGSLGTVRRLNSFFWQWIWVELKPNSEIHLFVVCALSNISHFSTNLVLLLIYIS